jgi:hypothetical protein
MFLNSLGNIFASREENFVSATKDSTGEQTGKHLRKHRESEKILNKSSANFTEDINTIQTPGLDKDVFLFNLLHPSHPNNFKDDVHSVLRISSAHNKGGPPDINIAQILHLSNFFELKRTVVYIHLQV